MILDPLQVTEFILSEMEEGLSIKVVDSEILGKQDNTLMHL